MENEKLTYINSRGERLELGVDSVYHCNISKDVEGISGVTSVIYSTNSMGQHGDTYVGQRIEARDIDVVGHINTRDKAQALELRRRMLKIFNPELSATLVYEYGGFKRVIDCRAYGEPKILKKEVLYEFDLQIECLNPFWREEEETKEDIASWVAAWHFPCVIEKDSTKQALLNHAKQAGVSIADLNMQLGFLWEELQGYTAVMDALKKAGSVRAASDAVLTGYEKPADQSETVKKKRAEYGEGYYKKYAAGNGTKYYRVRKSWTDAASQLGAFTSLENAKSACKAGYTVYDDNGKAVYTAAGQQTSAGVPFSVQVDILDLNIRTGAGTNYAKTGETTGKGVFTIVEVKAGQGASAGWGRLKSGAGWISLDYATRLA